MSDATRSAPRRSPLRRALGWTWRLALLGLLLVVAFPAALIGLTRCVRALHSQSHRQLARAGIVFSVLALLPLLVAVVVLSMTAAYCSTHQCI